MFDETIQVSPSGMKFQLYKCDYTECDNSSAIPANSKIFPRHWTKEGGKHFCTAPRCVFARKNGSAIKPNYNEKTDEVPVVSALRQKVEVTESAIEKQTEVVHPTYVCVRCGVGSNTGDDWWIVNGYSVFCNKRSCRDYVLSHHDIEKLHRNMVEGYEGRAA